MFRFSKTELQRFINSVAGLAKHLSRLGAIVKQIAMKA
jgi:hypothetical protein